MMSLYRGMDAATLEARYNLRAARGDDFDALMQRWIDRCAAFRHACPSARLDIAYGSGARHTLDLFSGGDRNGPLLVYIHGGYWQRGDKSMYSFVSEAFIQNGVSVAVLNYDLTPAVRIGQITRQIRQAIAWLWRQGDDLGFAQEKMSVMGHSAGGHLTAMMLATNWPAYDSALPERLIEAGIPISGLFELEPLVHTSINDGPQMSVAEAIAESPLLMPLRSNASQLVVTGSAETSELRRQSDAYVEKFQSPDRAMERYEVPGMDHFDELEPLADANSELFNKSLQLIAA